MAEFKSWRSFRGFEHAVKQQTRYVRTSDMEDFLDVVRETAEKRVEILAAETPLWRAQLEVEWRPEYDGDGDWIGESPWPHGKDRMKPLRDCATEGRANPKGIPYLYLATDRDTAIAEVRPWIGSEISVGLFKTQRELRVVNCMTRARLTRVFLEEPSAEDREKTVWIHIDEAFSRPVTRNEDVADYVPSQIIAELFKAQGYDGIAFGSSVSETGYNVVLFDLDAADIVEGLPFEVTKVDLQSKPIGNPVRYR
jgi:RES domain-containing protein